MGYGLNGEKIGSGEVHSGKWTNETKQSPGKFIDFRG